MSKKYIHESNTISSSEWQYLLVYIDGTEHSNENV